MRRVGPNATLGDLIRGLQDLERDLDAVRSGRLRMGADLDMRGYKITGLPTPVDASDAQPKLGSGDAEAILTVIGVGTGSGIVSGVGTDGHVARWDGTTNLKDSTVVVSDTGEVSGVISLALEETGAGTDAITLTAPASIASAYTFTFPDTGGTNLFVLQTNGSGTTSWVAQSGGAISFFLGR